MRIFTDFHQSILPICGSSHLPPDKLGRRWWALCFGLHLSLRSVARVIPLAIPLREDAAQTWTRERIYCKRRLYCRWPERRRARLGGAVCLAEQIFQGGLRRRSGRPLQPQRACSRGWPGDWLRIPWRVSIPPCMVQYIQPASGIGVRPVPSCSYLFVCHSLSLPTARPRT